MNFEFSDSQKALRAELRAYFADLVTPEIRAATRTHEGNEVYKATIRQLGKDGWLSVGWPKEYGGRGFSNAEQLIFYEEVQLAHIPFPIVTVQYVAPTLMMLGTTQQKEFYLPRIAAGECHFCIGYSEPNSGTDLASLKTSAVLEGDEYLINGNKVFTSAAEAADYVWLATRTDPAAPPHKGVSLIIVPTDDPGFSFAPLYTVGERTNVTYYQDIRVPLENLVGEENRGWAVITTALNNERIGIASFGIRGWGLLQRTLAWAKETDYRGQRVSDIPWVQSTFGEVYARLQAMQLMNWRMAKQLDEQEFPDPALASAMKVSCTECLIEVVRLLQNITGLVGGLRHGSPQAALDGDLEDFYRWIQITTFGGGVSEVMRDMVARFGLGMNAYSRR